MKRIILLLAMINNVAFAADAPAAAAQCQACHGARGEGNAALKAPRLTAQPAAYLARQLDSYSNGTRSNSVMEPIAKGLSSQDRSTLASYYASLTAPRQPSAKSATNARGQLLAQRGDGVKEIQACANCHGPQGSGEPPDYPYLAGQDRGYLAASLHAWRDGSRNTDPSKQMPMLAKRLSDADIDAIASYYAALPAPAVTARRAPRSTPTPTTAPTPGSSPRQPGAGTEQGAPTTGGAQGPGGGGATRE